MSPQELQALGGEAAYGRASTRLGLIGVVLAVLSGRVLRIAMRCHGDALRLAGLADHETIEPSELNQRIDARTRER